MMIFIGAFLIVGIGLTYLISRSLKIPLEDMTNATDQISASIFDIKINVVTPDEFGQLGDSINNMA